MNGIRALGKAAKRIGVVFLVLGAVLFAASCGKDGNIYGFVDWDGTLYASSIGGFPAGGYGNTYYQISPGTYKVYYTLWDGTYYYPGWYLGPAFEHDPNWVYDCTYSVEADKGSFPFVDGEDRYFGLYLAYEGMYKAGDVSSIERPAQGSGSLTPMLGTQSWTQNGLRVTVTTKIVQLTPEEISKLTNSQMQKK